MCLREHLKDGSCYDGGRTIGLAVLLCKTLLVGEATFNLFNAVERRGVQSLTLKNTGDFIK